MFKTRALRIILVIVAIAGYVIVSGEFEMRRIAGALPSAQVTDAAAPVVDTVQLIDDVRTLSSPVYAGRRTGTEGNALAQKYVLQRFEALGLRAYGGSHVQPFSFTRTSIMGLLMPGKSYRTTYPSAANLVGYIPGTRRPDRVIVVSAHYDHLGIRSGQLYPGADDNASGVGAMLAVAAHFKAHPPENTIVFAAFDAEELGLHGARQFVASLPFPRSQLAMNINFDMVSHNDSNEIFAAGTSYTPALKALVGQAALRSTVHVRLGHDKSRLLAPVVEDWTDSSDHGPFHDAGVPFLYFGVEDHPDYHAPTDTFEQINQGFYGRVASLLADVAATVDKDLDSVARK